MKDIINREEAINKISDYMVKHKLSRFRMSVKLQISDTALERFMKNKPSSFKTIEKIRDFLEDLEC